MMETQNPYKSEQGSAPVRKSHHEVRARQILLAWICFCLTTFVATIIVSLAIGLVLVGLLVMMGAGQSTAERIRPIYTGACGFILPIPISLLCYWWSIRRIVLKRK